MSTQDAIGKRYMSNNGIFADAFNFLIYDGEPVIKPEELIEADTAEIALPYGNDARLAVRGQVAPRHHRCHIFRSRRLGWSPQYPRDAVRAGP